MSIMLANHFKKDLDILGKLIEEEFPDYEDAF